MCDNGPNLISDHVYTFEQAYNNVKYHVSAQATEEGIVLNLLGYDSFERLIEAIAPSLDINQKKIAVRYEFGKCAHLAANKFKKIKAYSGR